MNIESFLNEIIVDVYCDFCESEGLSEDEIESKLINVDGLEAEDKEIVIDLADELDDEYIEDTAYAIAKETHYESDIPADQLIKFLVMQFLIYHYNDKNNYKRRNLIEYLRNTSLDDIIEFFDENDEFGRDTIKSFINIQANEKFYAPVRKRLQEEEPQLYKKFEARQLKEEIITLNNLLRRVLCNLYDHFISNGCDDITALNNIWAYLLHDFDPLGELDKMGIDQRAKTFYKNYMINLMYADLYEDICNDSILVSANYEDRLAQSIPLITTHIGLISLPKEQSIRNRILKHFILLQDEKEKLRANREKTIEEKRLPILKKINPTYFLDEQNFPKHHKQ